MRKLGILGIVSCLLILAFLLSLETYRFKHIKKNGPAVISPLSATIPASEPWVLDAIENTFNVWNDFARTGPSGKFQNKFPAGSKWSHFFLFSKSDPSSSVFPQDEVILLDRGNDPFIPRYVGIPANLRKNDFYLYEPTGDEFWASEYSYRGQPARFRSSFLIHVEPTQTASARVEIFEYQPQIWVGERFGFSAHAVQPGTFHDIRFVEPTTSDRLEVLSLILKSLVAQAE